MSNYSFQTGQRNTFSWLDYVIFAATLLFSASIGVFYAWKDRRKKNLQEFLMAGKDMNPFPVALSLLASFMSAITLLGTPNEMYTYTTMYWWIGLSYFFVIAGGAHIFVPIFYNLQLTSVYEYLERRFSKGVRTAGSLTFSTQMILYMAIVLYAPSLALNAVTNFTLWGSVISVGVVCTLYTTIGGMKAVLWTDTFQVGMMLAGLFALLIRGSMAVGGFAEAWRIAAENERVYFTDFSPDPSVRHSVWSLVVGGYFTWVAIYGTNQAQVQRACTCPTLRKAQIAYWLNFPGLCVILYVCCLIGIVLYAFYSTCDPITFKLVTAGDQFVPLFVMDVLGDVIGLPGLFVACLFSGALSTVSSGLNSLSAVILEDVVRAYIFKDMRESRATLISKVLILILGAICLALTYVASLLGGVLQAALSLFGMIGGPLLGVFTLGIVFPWSNKWGAFAGLFSGLIMMFWIGIGAQVFKPPQPKPPISITGCNWNLTTTTMMTTAAAVNAVGVTSPTLEAALNVTTTMAPSGADLDPTYPLYTLSYMWYSATAVLVTCVVGLIVSFITGYQRPSELDPRLQCPIFDVIFPFNFLPEAIRRPLRFGVRYEDVDKWAAEEREARMRAVSNVGLPMDGEHGKPEHHGLGTSSDKKVEATNGDASKMNGYDNPAIIPPSYDEAVITPEVVNSTRL